jgi:hypothetical protein
MALQSLNLWEMAIDGAQIILCGSILLCLIRNNIKTKQILLKKRPEGKETNFNARFIVEAIRQQSELAFNHIIETIDKEQKTLSAYFEFNENRIAPDLLKAAPMHSQDSHSSGAMDADAADAIYGEIENLADQGMSVAEISEKLDVPKGEVDLVIKLKHLGVESAEKNISPAVKR